ncbi:TPA: hypothetical protein ACRBS1_001753, partial [Streptococcus pyogenes]
MENKPAKASFFKLSSSKESNLKLFIEKMEEMFDNFRKKQYSNIPTLEINDLMYYINAMQKVTSEEELNGTNLFYWLVTISRVDTESPIILANLEKNIDVRKREIEHGDNEGLVVDTRLLFDPFRQILVVYNQRGTINNYDLRRFFCQIIGVRGLKFDIILNSDAFKRVGKLDVVNSISYTVASPTNFKEFRDDTQSENADLKFANSMLGESMQVVIKSNHLSKKNIFDKFSDMLVNDSVNVKNAKVEGLTDGHPELIDLIKNKLEYKGTIFYENTLDDEAVYAFLNTAYS